MTGRRQAQVGAALTQEPHQRLAAALACASLLRRSRPPSSSRSKAYRNEPPRCATRGHEPFRAAGAMPMSREKSFARPSDGRRRGRPKGSRNKATRVLEAVLEGAAEELTRKLIAKALGSSSAPA
jgi:hypothetical protein